MAGIIGLAYSVWLGAVILSTLAQTRPGEFIDVGLGVFLLTYAAVPATVALLSLRLFVSDHSGRGACVVIGVLAAGLAAAQLGWLLDLAPRAAREPVSFAFGATVATIVIAIADLVAATRAQR